MKRRLNLLFLCYNDNRGAIYDRNTTLDGVPLTSLLSEKEHSSKK